MKHHPLPLALAAAAAIASAAQADPLLESWFTGNSGRYARIYATYADEQAGNAVTTWNNGTYAQTIPAYAGVQQIHSDADFVYLTTTGLSAGHIMGPWYNDNGPGGSEVVFQNWPEAIRTIYRIPAQPVIPETKTTFPAGAIGLMVDGTIIFSESDTFSWDNAENGTGNGSDTGPGIMGAGQGDGLWLHDAYLTEGNTFDKSNAHAAGNQLHYHASPMKLRHLLEDSVDAVQQPNGSYLYQENFNGKHSPILGWLSDGLPLYGPYGYGDAMDPESGVRRMVSGFIVRNGENGSYNTAANGRTTLPAWAARYRNRSTACTVNEQGPTTATIAVPYFMEDYDYLGDLTDPADGQRYEQGVDFDLNEYNCRFCVTPEFPQGTWAYFVSIGADGNPAFPYNVGAQYYGDPSNGGSIASIPETAAQSYAGGPDTVESNRSATASGGDLVITWNVVEGGSYTIQASSELSSWNNALTGELATNNTLAITATPAENEPSKFYRITRTALATYDTGNGTGGGSGGGNTVSFDFTFATTPPLPPQGAIETSAVGGATATITAYNQTSGAVTLQFDNRALASGNHSATFSFTPPGQTTQTRSSTNQYTKP